MFLIRWEQGLTEMQENMYYNQPYEVEEIVETKMVEVVNTTYKKI